jgi:hypothetical protein
MIHRDTSLKIALPTGGIRRFIIFPQPSGASDFRHYSAQGLALFPPGVLRTEMRGGHEFLIGTVADLRFLFPVAAEIRADELLP